VAQLFEIRWINILFQSWHFVSRDQSVGHLAAEGIPKPISDAFLFYVIWNFVARSSRGIWKMEKCFSSKQKSLWVLLKVLASWPQLNELTPGKNSSGLSALLLLLIVFR